MVVANICNGRDGKIPVDGEFASGVSPTNINIIETGPDATIGLFFTARLNVPVG
jgi:hypothetical protein